MTRSLNIGEILPMTKEEIVNVLIQDMEELRDPETRWELNDANIDAHIFYIKELANG